VENIINMVSWSTGTSITAVRILCLAAAVLCHSFATYGQGNKIFNGIAVEKSGTPIPFCTVSVKGTKIADVTNACGQFQLETDQKEVTVSFSCMSTHDFITFERRINLQHLDSGDTIVFRLKQHGRIVNKECKKRRYKSLQKLIVNISRDKNQ
jgi:hypothetical protein